MNKFQSFLKYFLHYIFFLLLLLVLVWIGYFKIYGNLHQVDKNFYRSAQLYSFNLSKYIQMYHIRSIINLRGHSSDQWYKDELSISQENNITHYDFGISDRSIISQQKMEELIDLIKKAPKPLLIHCKAGADRTSLATALYLYEVKHNLDESYNAFSIIYGHFPWFGSKTEAMDESFKNYIKHKQEKKVSLYINSDL